MKNTGTKHELCEYSKTDQMRHAEYFGTCVYDLRDDGLAFKAPFEQKTYVSTAPFITSQGVYMVPVLENLRSSSPSLKVRSSWQRRRCLDFTFIGRKQSAGFLAPSPFIVTPTHEAVSPLTSMEKLGAPAAAFKLAKATTTDGSMSESPNRVSRKKSLLDAKYAPVLPLLSFSSLQTTESSDEVIEKRRMS